MRSRTSRPTVVVARRRCPVHILNVGHLVATMARGGKRGRESLILTSGERGGRLCGYATTITFCQRRLRVPRAQSRGGAGPHFCQAAGLRGVRRGAAGGEGTGVDAALGLVGAPQPLAPRTLAPRRWRTVGVHAMDDGHAYAALARGASHGRNRSFVPGAIQIVSDPGGRASADGAALCGTQRACARIS